MIKPKVMRPCKCGQPVSIVMERFRKNGVNGRRYWIKHDGDKECLDSSKWEMTLMMPYPEVWDGSDLVAKWENAK